MKKLLICLMMSGMSTIAAIAQSLTNPPEARGAYLYAGGAWAPFTSAAGFGALLNTPPPVALYCQATAGASWTPCTGAGSGGGGGTGTVNSGSAFSPAYYPASGTAVSGTTPFNGISFWSTSAAPTAATSAQIVAALNNSSTTTLNAVLLPLALQNNTTGTTQTAGDTSTKLATDQFAATVAAAAASAVQSASVTGVREGNGASPDTAATSSYIQSQTFGTVGPLQTLIANPKNGLVGVGGIPTANLTGLYLFDATDYAGGSGTILYDHSGNGNNCTIPTGTGAPVWSVTSSGVYYLAFSSSTTQDLICSNITTFGTAAVLTASDSNPSLTSNTYYALFGEGSSATNGVVLFPSSYGVNIANSSLVPAYANGGTYASATGMIGNGFNWTSWSVGGPANTYQNGVLMNYAGLNTGNPPTVAAPTGAAIEIGGNHWSGVCSTACIDKSLDIYAVAIYSTPQTGPQNLQLYNGIYNYEIQKGITVGSLATTATPIINNLVLGLTSIPCGTGSGVPLSSDLSLGTTYSVHMGCMPGSSLQDHLSAGMSMFRYFFNPAALNIAYIDAPTNNGCENTAEATLPAAAWGLEVQVVQQLRVIGYKKFILNTMASRTGNGQGSNTGSTCDVFKNTINAIIRSNYSALGQDVSLNDIGATVYLGADGAYANPVATNFTDGIHPVAGTASGATSTGQQLYAHLLSDVLAADIGAYSQNNPNSQAGTYSMSYADRWLLTPITAATTDTLPADCNALEGRDYHITNTSSSFTLTIASSNTAQTISGSTTVSPLVPAVYTAEPLLPVTAGGCYWLRTQ